MARIPHHPAIQRSSSSKNQSCYTCSVGTLILLRHGQSQWNLENRFAGWSDIPLTERGIQDSLKAAEVLKKFNIDIAFTSRLQRAQQTLKQVVSVTKQKFPVVEDSALNERHYGSLQGLNRAETAAKHGADMVQKWRRSFFTRPPDGESMEDCERRTWPFFKQYMLPHVIAGKTVIVVAHGNSLRPIIKNLDGLDPDTTAALEIGLCTPYIYTFDGEKMTGKEIIEVPGVVTQGGSLTEKQVKEGRV